MLALGNFQFADSTSPLSLVWIQVESMSIQAVLKGASHGRNALFKVYYNIPTLLLGGLQQM